MYMSVNISKKENFAKTNLRELLVNFEKRDASVTLI